MANNKKLIWIGIGSALLIGGGMFWWWKNKNSATNTDTSDNSNDTKKTDEKSEPIASNPIIIKDKSVTPTGNNPKPTPKDEVKGFSNGKLVYLNKDNASLYSFPEFKGEFIIGDVSKVKLLDKPFAKFIQTAANGFIKVETIAFTPLCPPNARCTGQLQPIKRIAYISKQFVSDKPY
jgi:hypothetical protein